MVDHRAALKLTQTVYGTDVEKNIYAAYGRPPRGKCDQIVKGFKFVHYWYNGKIVNVNYHACP